MLIVTHERLLADLQAAVRAHVDAPCDIRAYPVTASDSEIASAVDGADVFVGAEFRAAWSAQSLRLLHVPGAGTDGIDRSRLPAGCVVCNAFGHEWAVAEHAFLLMLALNKQLLQLDGGLRRGNWRWEKRMTPELRGQRLLILGLGRIGQELVRWARFFSMPVMAVSRTARPGRQQELGLAEAGVFGDLPRFLPEADFVVIALPGTDETRNLLGDRELRLMKPSACLVNVGRAPVVNESALYEALREGRIAGAGLDVWYKYPNVGEDAMPASLPFHELPNVIMTPHNGGYTPETMQARWKVIGRNIANLAQGRPLENIVAGGFGVPAQG